MRIAPRMQTQSSWIQVSLVTIFVVFSLGSAIGCGAPGAKACVDTRMCSVTPTPPAAPAAGATLRPCDIYAADGGPCVAAHSTARALYATYDGPLYQVRKADGTTHDVLPVAAGGIANAADQDDFCGV